MDHIITAETTGEPLLVRHDLRTRQVGSAIAEINPALRAWLEAEFGPDLGPTVLSLTPRAPYTATGLVDFYAPGRWDCTVDQVFMESIHQVGPSVGQWEGTVGYARWTAESAGSYLVALAFSGLGQTMRMSGPFGDVTMASAGGDTLRVVTATVTAAADGTQLWTDFSAREDHGWAGLAYFHEFSVHRLA